MDLRKFNPSAADVDAATRLLAYQPFIISDEVCTGVAYNWLHAENAETAWQTAREVYDLKSAGPEKFRVAQEANAMLRKTYDHFISGICKAFPGGSYLDVSCNTGYFPIAASLLGMKDAAGMDPLDHADAFQLLNRITGAKAEFIRGGYLPAPPSLAVRTAEGAEPFRRQFDVVSNLEFMCHLADPLHFLHAIARHAKKAVFLWSGFIQSDEYLIRLNPPLGSFPSGFQDYFFSRFSSGTAITTGLLFRSMAMLDFPVIVEFNYPAGGLPPNWHEKNMAQYQPHRAFLFAKAESETQIREALGG